MPVRNLFQWYGRQQLVAVSELHTRSVFYSLWCPLIQYVCCLWSWNILERDWGSQFVCVSGMPTGGILKRDRRDRLVHVPAVCCRQLLLTKWPGCLHVLPVGFLHQHYGWHFDQRVCYLHRWILCHVARKHDLWVCPVRNRDVRHYHWRYPI